MSASAPKGPTRLILVYETPGAARDRLVAHGYPAAIAEEIAVYLAQATDLEALAGELGGDLRQLGIATQFVELDALPALVPSLRGDAADTILWCQTDGIRFYRGSSVAALARLVGVARYGSPPLAQHLCQDKFASLSVAAGAGLPVVPTLLLEGEDTVAALGTAAWDDIVLFVKPATLGAKIGIFADSRCRGLADARRLAARLWERYRDRAVVQPYIEGDDVRVSYMNGGGDFAAELGVAQLAKDPRSETAGAFMTMKDNDTLSGSRDTAGGRGGFGEGRAAAFVPAMLDLKGDARPRARNAVAAITDAAARLRRLLRLDDYFTMDFRIAADGTPSFLEFEVCPAVTIYDFQDYLRSVHGLGLAAALARSLRLAYGRAAAMEEA